MRSFFRILAKVFIAVVVVVLGCFVYMQVRGGHYPRYAAAAFANLSAPVPGGAPAGEPLAQTDAGAVRGAYEGSTAVFKGVPFARPPVGDLRWTAPEPMAPWTGVREATRPGHVCMQDPKGLTPFIGTMARAYGSDWNEGPLDMSEDCLYLNIWSPQLHAKQGLPVMVWLHGGSNRVGAGSETTYNGAALAARGVVLVTVNYRLGVIGFFSHPELTAESPHKSSGNYGLLDQLAALAWVKKNIAQFGGDPGNVTLFGESAGAVDSGMLMTSPLAADLFRRVISESGPVFNGAQSLAQAEALGKAAGDLAAGDPQQTPLQRLRALPPAQMEKLLEQAKERVGGDTSTFTVDGWVLKETPQQAFLNGSIQKVDLLIGFNGRELSAFRLAAAAPGERPGSRKSGVGAGGLKQFTETARPFFGAWTKPAMAFYLGDMVVRRAVGLDHAVNDLIGACPVGAMAGLATAAGQRVFVYRFDRSVPGKGEKELGAFHSLEIPYVFGTQKDSTWQWLPFTSDDAALSNLMQTYWTNFARTGDPNAQGLPVWPVWGDARKEFLVVRKDADIAAERNFPPVLSDLSVEGLKKRLQGK